MTQFPDARSRPGKPKTENGERSAIFRPMLSLILATESVASNPPGDDLAMIAYIAFGVAMVFTAIATVIVTPSAEKH